MPHLIALLLACLLLPRPLADGVEQQLHRGELKGARLAVCVVDVVSGERLYARDIDTPMAPASNMKLVTTAAALSLLGAEHVFTTRLLATDAPDAQGRTPHAWAEGVFLATHPPQRKPETIALLERLQSHGRDGR